MYWPKILMEVVQLISHGGLEKGDINYDSDISRVQVNGGELPFCFDLSNYDFVDCKLAGS
jgi:xylose isomerase